MDNRKTLNHTRDFLGILMKTMTKKLARSIQIALTLTISTTLSPLVSFATTPNIPSAGTPGGALPILPTPFSTSMPFTLGPLNNQADSSAPSVTNPSDFHFAVKKIEVSGMSQYSTVDSLAVNKLAEKLRLKYLNKDGEMTIDNLNKIGELLTNYFGQEGYFLTKVYLPPQDVKQERTVKFEVREGYLENIEVQGDCIYTKKQLEEPFKKYLGKPIKAADIESGLLILRDYPGLEVNSVFKPGKTPGGTNMLIQITQSDRLSLTANADNYGNNVTGQYRGTFTVDAYNLTHGADDLSLTFLQQKNPSNSEFYETEYTRNFFSPKTKINLGYSYNRYTLGDTLTGQGLGGQSQIYHINLDRSLIRSRFLTLNLQTGINHDAGYLKQNSSMLNRDKITFSEIALSSVLDFSSLNLVNTDQISYQHGFNNFLDSMGTAPYQGQYPARQGGSGQYAQGKFNLESLSVNFYQRPANYQLIEWQVYGQYSADLLTSFSQLTFGGQSALPGYDTSEYLVDKGFTSHLEWKFPIPGLTDRMVPKTSYHFGDLLHLSVFTDYGNGWLNDPSSDETGHIALADYGVGLYVSLGAHLQFETLAARYWTGMTRPADDQAMRYWVGLSYNYTGF